MITIQTMWYILGGIIGLLAVWAIGSYIATRNLESPRYEVLLKQNGYEVRQYDPYIVAEATVASESYQKDLNSGFRLVADYIFGNNTSKEKISMTTPVLEETDAAGEKMAMTVPVLEEVTENETRTIAFVLPSKYSMDTLPMPNNNQVTLREVPGKKVAALGFTWYATPDRIAAKKEALLAKLEADGIERIGTPQTALYNPPLSFPLTLRNEILVPIK